MKFTVYALAALAFAVAACTGGEPRTLESPFVAATNNDVLEVTEVALSDSATTLSFHARFNPGMWIRIAGESRLVAGDKNYGLTGADGIDPDSLFYMPESGEYDFTLTFEPLPLSTAEFDFTEGMPDGWALYGIDATGKGEPVQQLPEGLPKEIKDAVGADLSLDPVLEVAPTDIRIHQLGYRPEYGNSLSVWTNSLAGQEEYSVTLDENGNGTLSTTLYGPTYVNISYGGGVNSFSGRLTVAPGETTDVYLSPKIFSEYYKDACGKEVEGIQFSYNNGRYAALSNYASSINKYSLKGDVFNKADWHMSTDEYTDCVVASRDSLKQALAAAEDMPEGVKRFIANRINLETLSLLANAGMVLRNDYLLKHPQDEYKTAYDSVKVELTNDHYARAIEGVDADDRSYLIDPYSVDRFDDEYSWAKGLLFSEIPQYAKIYKRAKAGRVSDGELASLDSLSDPFFAKAVSTRQKEAEEVLNALLDEVGTDPSVPGEQLFKDIIGKHKGKVVLVDLWNTWCGPCRGAIAHNEPLKTGELADDDIVWIYIADESSDVNKYADMIKDIKGEHHLVNEQQIQAIRKAFDVDGIPFYILVDREGKAVGHPDFRDQNLLIKGIKEKL